MKKIFYSIFILVFISGCTLLKTPEIKGIVLDAETGKPIADARIYAKWQRTVSGPGGQTGGKVVRELRLRTKEDGVFGIPSYNLINPVPYPFGQGGTFYVVVYAHSYKYKSFTFHESENFEKPKYEEFKIEVKEGIKIKLEEIKNDETYFFQIGKNLLETGEDYYLKDMRFFIDKFSNSKWCATIQNYIAQYYENKEDYSNAIKEYEILIKKYPDSGFVPYAQKAIERIGQRKKGGV